MGRWHSFRTSIRAVQIDGPLGAYLSSDQLDVPLTYEALAELGGMLGHGGIVVLDDTVDMAKQAHFAMDFAQSPAVSVHHAGSARSAGGRYWTEWSIIRRHRTT